MSIRTGIYYQGSSTLSGEDIDLFSEVISYSLEKCGIERQNILRVRLSLEEALLRMRDRYGEGQQLSVSVRPRRRHILIQAETEGDPFNPLSSSESELGELGGSLLATAGLTPQYSYAGRKNTLRIRIPLPSLSPVIKILIAIGGGVLVGCLGNLLMSPALQSSVIGSFLQPLYDLWLRILNTMSGLVVFFMVITTIMDTESISQKGGNSVWIVIRYFLFSFLVALAAVLSAWAIFRGGMPSSVTGAFRTGLKGLPDLLLQAVPDDIVTPFATANTPQILLVAIVLGASLNTIGMQAKALRRVIRQINMVGLQITEWVSRLVPYFLGILIGMEIWQRRTRILGGVWKCILLAMAVSLVCFLVVLLYVSRREKAGFCLLVKKLWKPFWLAVRYGSLDAAFGETESCCIRKLGISREYIERSLPGGLVLYMPISVVGTLIFIVYAAIETGIQTSLLWYVVAMVLSVVVFVATPPVPGANILAYVVTFAQLGIAQHVLIDAMLFDIVFGVFAGAGNQLLLQLELILQADRIGMLNAKRLLKESAQ